MWLYGSGFPKSMDISKQIDKRNGKQNEDFTKFGNYLKQKREEKKLSKNDIDKIMKTNTAYSWWEGRNYLGDFIVQLPDKENYYKLKEVLNLDDRFDYLIEWQEAEREVIGEKIDPDGKPRSTRYKNVVSNPSAWNTLGTKEKIEKATYLTAPATDLAKQWQGWGTALKPSFEPIIVARKPFKGSLVDNVIEYGVGGINIDECRVKTNDNLNGGAYSNNTEFLQNDVYGKYKKMKPEEYKQPNGRFPANTILTYDETDFDEVCGGFPINKSIRSNRGGSHNSKNDVYGGFLKHDNFNGYECGYNDSGSASRYFYCAKASKKDRDEGLDEFEEKNTMCDRNPELASANMPQNRSGNLRKNTHPTVKPTELMQYLVRLVTPDNGIVLDPFNGSGSTGKAVMYENRERNKNYKYIGIELTEEYLPIAKARIEYVCNLEPEKDNQLTIFDFIEEE
jgi:transcriptional regulator with XRE-family HTH domain